METKISCKLTASLCLLVKNQNLNRKFVFIVLIWTPTSAFLKMTWIDQLRNKEGSVDFSCSLHTLLQHVTCVLVLGQLYHVTADTLHIQIIQIEPDTLHIHIIQIEPDTLHIQIIQIEPDTLHIQIIQIEPDTLHIQIIQIEPDTVHIQIIQIEPDTVVKPFSQFVCTLTELNCLQLKKYI